MKKLIVLLVVSIVIATCVSALESFVVQNKNRVCCPDNSVRTGCEVHDFHSGDSQHLIYPVEPECCEVRTYQATLSAICVKESQRVPEISTIGIAIIIGASIWIYNQKRK